MHASYRHVARVYDTLIPIFSFGAASRIHRAVAQAVPSGPRTTVVDAGCGTGLAIPLLRERVGPEGKVIGIDMTEPMLARARSRVSEAGWSNIELHCADMADFTPEDPPDAAVFSLSLSTTESEKALRHTIGYLRPGATVVIADGIPAYGRWYHPMVNLYARLRARFVGSDRARALNVDRLSRECLVDVRTQIIWAGLYTVISGRTPGAGIS